MATYGTYQSPGGFKLTVYGIVIAICFMLGIYVTRAMFREHNTGPVNAERAEQRKKARLELQAEAARVLNGTSTNAQNRLPIDEAMRKTVQAYQNPEAGRADLIARMKTATAPAPKAPEQPSEFE